jgi:hypothetical protein
VSAIPQCNRARPTVICLRGQTSTCIATFGYIWLNPASVDSNSYQGVYGYANEAGEECSNINPSQEGSLLLACARVPVCPRARGSGLCPWSGGVPGCPCARGSNVVGACCLSATQTLYSPEVTCLHHFKEPCQWTRQLQSAF